MTYSETESPKAPPKLLDLPAVCGMLGVTTTTGYRWIAQGRFPVPVVRVGSLLRFRPNEVEALVLGQSEGEGR